MAKMFKPSTSHDSMSSLDAALLAQYREAFDSFDSNRDGRISIRELSAVMENLGESPSKKELKEMIKSVDGDGSGKIDFDEFIRMMEARTAQRMSDAEMAAIFASWTKTKTASSRWTSFGSPWTTWARTSPSLSCARCCAWLTATATAASTLPSSKS
ncbi:hypothetical protein BOX15_Mlig004939g3 [Macrostomum lignano]|uniref:EF-hand domain-containing protein n=1 Tax=Macrostomum lignano TaxID=282301 RepID=A0A267FNM6_9PLAT|nr:hypothetical protein BOX15_Mlig004939g3 [Macrostomum lignano]